VCPLLVSHCSNCASLAYLAVLSVGGHITCYMTCQPEDFALLNGYKATVW